MIELYVTSTETRYTDDNVEIHLWGRDSSGSARQVVVDDFEPYFYVLSEEADRLEPKDHSALKRVEETDIDSLFGEDLTKIVATDPGGIPDLSDQYDKTFEADVVFTNRFRVDTEIYTGVRAPSERCSVDDLEAVEITDRDIRYCYFDIEIADELSFPVQDGTIHHTDSEILSIAAYDSWEQVYHGWVVLPDDEIEQSMPSVVETGEPPGELDKLHYFGSEERLLESFFDWVSDCDPDVLLAWNVTFDAGYVIERAKSIGMDAAEVARGDYPEAGHDGRYGETSISGRVVYDLMGAWESMQYTEVSSSLNNAADMELDGDQKIEHEADMVELWRDDTAELMAYNAKDVELMVRIDEAAGVMQDRRELKEAVGADFEFTTESNEFIEMQVRRKLHEWQVAGTTKTPPPDTDDEYEGAYTFPAFEGVEENVVSIDLSSLYPFTMKMLNASPETYVGNMSDKGEYNGRVSWAPNGACFRQDEDGLFRALVDDALELTKQAGRRRDEHDPGSDEWEYWNQAREARKRIRNSIYGVLGWVWFFLYHEPTAEAVTTMGQKVIRTSADWINENSVGEVVYGDSVPGYEPVTIKKNGRVNVVPIERLTGYEIDDLQVWNDSGWTGVDAVMEKPNRKQMYRVTTGSGVVHVTEDHGLLRPDGTEVTPDNVEVGDCLLHNEQAIDQFDKSGMPKESEYEPTNDRAWLLGLFVGDGSCGSYDATHARNSDWKQTKQSWAINNTDNQLLSKASRILEEEWGMGTNVAESMESSGVKKLQPQSGDSRDPKNSRIRELVTEFRSLCYTDSGKKKVPTEILNGDREAVLSFLSGYQAADGDKSDRYDKVFHRSYTNSHTLAAGISNLLRRLGMEAGIETRDNHDKEYIRIWSRSYTKGDSTEIQSIEQVDYDGENVYDISTENEHFNAGVGTITVHNTDSCYISWPDDWTIEDALHATDDVVETLNNDVYPELAEEHGMGDMECQWEIEMEDANERMFQAGKKKRYAKRSVWKEGMDFSETLAEPEVKIVGFEYKRSDTASLTATLQKEILSHIVRGNSNREIRECVFEAAQQIERENPDWEQIGIPGGIGQPLDEYDSETAQVRAAKCSNEVLGTSFGHGDKPMRIYLEQMMVETDAGSVNTDVIAFEDETDLGPVKDALRVDVGRMRDVLIEKPMSRILDPIGVDVEAAMVGRTQKSISDWV